MEARADREVASSREIVAHRYELGRLLGTGGMGSVYAAVDLSTGDTVALKKLPPDSPAQTRALFEREYQTLTELRHPNIVTVYDYGASPDGAFYTMELVAGRELRVEAPMEWREACRVLRDVASVLSFLHARRLLHRDLSPRNLIVTDDGRLKLIDFGALCRFGAAAEIIGTPPFVPPEALSGAALDQRADLFAFGALGYWLITGANAFPARSLAALPALHATRPPLASTLVALDAGQEPSDPIPNDLDALLAALLSTEVRERPTSAAAVIDRLNTIASLPLESAEHSAGSYLQSNEFVGRGREVELVMAALERALRGSGESVLIECPPGFGRSRLLRQLTVLARLRGALALSIDASHGQRAFAGAAALASALLDALPFEARAEASALASHLGRLSNVVRVRLGVDPQLQRPQGAGDSSVKTQAAMRDWLRAVAARRCLAIFVDDMHMLDDETRRLLVALADGISEVRVLLVATSSSTAEGSPALLSYRSMSKVLAPAAFDEAQTLEVLGSIFGKVPYLERCSQRLWRACSGNPGHLLELAQQLVERGLARYVEGTWTLPAELTPEQLPATREHAQQARLGRLSPDARALAQRLSVPHVDPIPERMCLALADMEASRALAALRELVREDVLVQGSAGYLFVHAALQSALYAELDDHQRARSNVAFGRALIAEAHADGLQQLRAALYLLRGEELAEAARLLTRAVDFYRNRSADAMATMSRAAPLFEEATLTLQAKGASDYQLAPLLGILALSAYYVDRRYEPRFGPLAIACYERLLKLSLARRLSRILGAKLALLIAFLVSHLAFRRQPHGGSLKQTITDFATTSSCLSGAATVYIAPKLARQYVDALAPFAPLGPAHTLNVVHDLGLLFSLLVTDRISRTAEGVRTMLGRIERGEVLRDMPEGRRRDCIAGLYLCLGVQACWKDGVEALQIADRIEGFSPLHAMTADHFRASYYANLGDADRVEYYRKRIETHAVQLGSAWQVELWAPVDAAKMALRLEDPMIIRRVLEDLRRLGAELPSVAAEERRARGMYFVLSGQYERALPFLDTDEEPGAVIGWTFSRGALARAYNGLGQHQRAKQICEAALALRDAGDRHYPVMGLNVEIELAKAESGLGNHGKAAAQLDELCAVHGVVGGAITMGALHEARVEVALRAGDLGAARSALAEMDKCYRPTGVATLIERIEELRRTLGEGVYGAAANDNAREQQRDTQITTKMVAALEAQAELGFAALANLSLELLCERTAATAGFVLIDAPHAEEKTLVAHAAPDRELIAWAQHVLQSANEDEQTEVGDSQSSLSDPLTISSRGLSSRAFPLRHLQSEAMAYGVLVLSFEGRVVQPPLDLLSRIFALLSKHAPRPRPTSRPSMR